MSVFLVLRKLPDLPMVTNGIKNTSNPILSLHLRNIGAINIYKQIKMPHLKSADFFNERYNACENIE